MFKKSALAIAVLLLCGSMICAAQPVVPVGLVDSTPANGILVNYNDWYAANAKPNDPKISGQTIFTSPRAVVMVRDGGIGTLAKNHFHSATDEIVIVMGGSGEILINDVWTPVKSGDIHINPRGNIHATRVNGSQDLKFISIFTPVTPTGGDANFLEEGKPVSIPVGLVDSTPANGILVNYDDWYAANAKPNDPKISGQTIFTSPRAVVMVRDGGIGTLAKRHFHAVTDEIVVVMGGSGEILINDVWTPVKSGDIHINPRGNIHATRVNGSQDLKFISIFTPVTPTGGDANFLE